MSILSIIDRQLGARERDVPNQLMEGVAMSGNTVKLHLVVKGHDIPHFEGQSIPHPKVG
jgi:hypothetical protein